jgi:hypothetical protein
MNQNVSGSNVDNGLLGSINTNSDKSISSNETDFNYKVLLQIKMLRTILQDKGSKYTQTEINHLLDQLTSIVDLATVQSGNKLYPHFI